MYLKRAVHVRVYLIGLPVELNTSLYVLKRIYLYSSTLQVNPSDIP